MCVDAKPLRMGPLGIRLFISMQKDPIGVTSRIQREFGDVALLRVMGRRIYYFFSPEAAQQILGEHHADFTRDTRALEILGSFLGRNVLTSEGPGRERQRRILAPGFSPRRIAGYMALMNLSWVAGADPRPQPSGAGDLPAE